MKADKSRSRAHTCVKFGCFSKPKPFCISPSFANVQQVRGVSLHLCVCMRTCTHACTCMSVYVSAHAYAHEFACTRVCMHACIRMHRRQMERHTPIYRSQVLSRHAQSSPCTPADMDNIIYPRITHQHVALHGGTPGADRHTNTP